MFAPFDHEEEGSKGFVGNGDNGTLVATADYKRLELGLEDGRGATGGMGEITEQTMDLEIALADMAGLSLAGRLVITGADADP